MNSLVADSHLAALAHNAPSLVGIAQLVTAKAIQFRADMKNSTKREAAP
jgi:hypothetical protein